jgi:hypothetical protein
MYNHKPTLRELVERDLAGQNGFGYEDFVKIAAVKKRPSYTSVARIFNRDSRTIKKWFERYEEEKK